METALGVAFDNFAILATGKSECFSIIRLSEESEKIYQLTSQTALAMVGDPGDTDYFSRYVQCNFELEKFRDDGWEVSPERAFHWITWNLAKDIHSKRPYEVFPILGGFDKRGKVYWMDYLGTGVEVSYGAHGYGEPFATAYLDRNHRPDMNEAQAIEVVQGALNAIQNRIVVRENRFHLVIIDKDGVRKLPDHVIGVSK